jgi:hypothetical protein
MARSRRRSCSRSPAASSSDQCSARHFRVLHRIEHVPSAIIPQFVTTFGV